MRAIARFDGHVEPCAFRRHVEKQSLVIDFQNVGAELAEPACDPSQHARAIIDLDAQIDDPMLTTKAQEAAARLGLAFERRFTGYGELGTFMRRAANLAKQD